MTKVNQPACFPWRKVLRMFFVIDSLHDAVYPTKAQGFCDRIVVRNPGLAGVLFVGAEWTHHFNTLVTAPVHRLVMGPVWACSCSEALFGGRDTISRPHVACLSRRSLQIAAKS